MVRMGYGVDADQKLVPNFQRGLTGNGGLFTLWINYVFLVCALVGYLQFQWLMIKIPHLSHYLFGFSPFLLWAE